MTAPITINGEVYELTRVVEDDYTPPRHWTMTLVPFVGAPIEIEISSSAAFDLYYLMRGWLETD